MASRECSPFWYVQVRYFNVKYCSHEIALYNCINIICQFLMGYLMYNCMYGYTLAQFTSQEILLNQINVSTVGCRLLQWLGMQCVGVGVIK